MLKLFAGIILWVPFLLWAIVRIVYGVGFSIDCEQHLKRAADANTLPLAVQELTTVVKYCESHNLTSGIVSIFLRQPENDVGFWYSNISKSLDELIKLDSMSSSLEKSNMLMKLRETLLDSGSEGRTVVTRPDGIAIYPYNIFFFWWAVAGSVCALAGMFFLFAAIGEL